jgi:hypothetical protein
VRYHHYEGPARDSKIIYKLENEMAMKGEDAVIRTREKILKSNLAMKLTELRQFGFHS